MTARPITPAFWSLLLPAGLWLALVATALATRPPLPVDETRYLAVAWEMWRSGDYLVPTLNGEAYSHKPPLLFWLINLGWAAFGVGAWWPRLVAPLFGLASLYLTAALARRLWPDLGKTRQRAPLVLLASGFWALFTTLTMFDMLLAFCTLVGLAGLLRAWRGGALTGWGLLGIGIGLGLLAKGPAILLHTVPAALLAPLWGTAPACATGRRGWVGWYLGVVAAVALGAALALGWAVPAALAGGADFRDAIFWGQTAGRMVDSFAHARPWWWYAAALPVLLFPVTVWPPLWRVLRGLSGALADDGIRFCLGWFLPAFVAFSIISGKQLQYLLPEFPALALLLARLLDGAGEGEAGAGGRRDLTIPGTLAAVLGVAIVSLGTVVWPMALPAWVGALDPAWGLAVAGAGVAMIVVPPPGVTGRLALLAALAAAVVVAIHLIARPLLAEAFDVAPLAARLAAWEREGRPLAHYGKYHGQFHFPGRLSRPMAIIGDGEVKDWVARHPDGKIVTYHRHLPTRAAPDAAQPFRSLIIGVWDATAVRDDLDLVKRPE